MDSDPELEVRCPVGPQRLFFKMLKSDNDLPIIELACGDCARALRKIGRDVTRVLHRYTTDGDLIETILVNDEGMEWKFK